MSRAPGRTSALSPLGHAYVGAVAASGVLLLASCVHGMVRSGVPPLWYVFAALTVLSGALRVKVPSLAASLSVSEMFAFTGVLLFGAAEGAVILAVDGLIHSVRRRNTWEQSAFNCGNLTISAWLSGTVFFATSGAGPLIGQSGLVMSGLIWPLALLTLTYFLANSGMTAAAVALEARLPPFAVWREHFLWMCPTYFAGASVALLLVVALRQVQLSALALLPPLLFISYLTLRSTLGRVEDARSHLSALNKLYLSTVETLASAIDAKDEVTHGHIRRVQTGAVGLARELGVADADTLKAIEAAALLHDTGKLAVPEHILNKPGKLTPAEYERMKLHAPIGAEILSSIDFPYPVVPIVRHHHENWDGTGYPDGLRGDDIPIGARILSVVDCYDALTSDRPYRRRLPTEEAIRILVERRGTMYDPTVVDQFLKSHVRLMPQVDAATHPVARAMGQARARYLAGEEAPAVPRTEAGLPREALAINSLARALKGSATLDDVGPLVWTMIRNIVDCEACCLFVPDGEERVVVRYAAGARAASLRGVSLRIGAGLAGWVAAHGRTVLNADPALDFGSLEEALAFSGSLTVPLAHESGVVAVLGLYSTSSMTEEDQRVVELIAPHLAQIVTAVPLTLSHPSQAAPRPAPRISKLRVVGGNA